MKKIILLLVTVLSFYGMTKGAGRATPDIELVTVYEGTFVLADSTADTVIAKTFIPWADSLSFVAEIVSADSLNTDGAKTTIDARIRFLSSTGLSDTATYANLPVVINKPATGNAHFGPTVTMIGSKRGSKARLEVLVKNMNDGQQRIKIRIYAIKEWR